MDNRPEDNGYGSGERENRSAEPQNAEQRNDQGYYAPPQNAEQRNDQGYCAPPQNAEQRNDQGYYAPPQNARSPYSDISPYRGGAGGGNPYGFGVPPADQYASATGSKEKKGISLYAFIAMLVVTAVVTYQITALGYQAYYGGKGAADIPDYYSSALTVSDYLNTYYIGEMDEKLLRDALAAAVLYASGDAYAYYYTAEAYAEEQLSYGGNAVGIGIRVLYSTEYKGLEVLRVMVGF